MAANSSKEGTDEIKTERFSTKALSTSRQWTAFRNPRIVRVSRALGGKDRHSKVCTVRGLRDRRIRLSVPTAIQLYDLQDRLGLSQPSKVVDWLLEASKSDIDQLPPLQIPNCLSQFPHHQGYSGNNSTNNRLSLGVGGFYDSSTFGLENQSLIAKSSRFNWDVDLVSRLKGNQDHDGSESFSSEKGKGLIKETQGSAQKLFPNSSSLPGFLNNANANANSNANAMTCSNNYYQYSSEPSSDLSLSQIGSHGLLFPYQLVDSNSMLHHHHPSSNGSVNNVPFSSSLSASQLLLCPTSAMMGPSLFGTPHAPFMTNGSSLEISDPRQSGLMAHPFVPSLHPFMNSPLSRRLPTAPFSSKLLDSDNN